MTYDQFLLSFNVFKLYNHEKGVPVYMSLSNGNSYLISDYECDVLTEQGLVRLGVGKHAIAFFPLESIVALYTDFDYVFD